MTMDLSRAMFDLSVNMYVCIDGARLRRLRMIISKWLKPNVCIKQRQTCISKGTDTEYMYLYRRVVLSSVNKCIFNNNKAFFYFWCIWSTKEPYERRSERAPGS